MQESDAVIDDSTQIRYPKEHQLENNQSQKESLSLTRIRNVCILTVAMATTLSIASLLAMNQP